MWCFERVRFGRGLDEAEFRDDVGARRKQLAFPDEVHAHWIQAYAAAADFRIDRQNRTDPERLIG